MKVILAGLLTVVIGCFSAVVFAGEPVAQETGNPTNAKVVQVTKEKRALETVKELEKLIAQVEKESPTRSVTVAQTAAPNKSIQEKLDKEHEKARKGGYDKEFHEAIKNNGGKKLKEEWKNNCNSKPLNKKELNCY
ncbi:MAG: hypothetical protein Q8K77_06125 [Thermodesulfovibrionales bacterium]|nr:hypothetical protein [Thermodesulfovibrionales bacterium]